MAKRKTLKCGFSTGACAAATAKAAYLKMVGEKVKLPIKVFFPDQTYRIMKLKSVRFDGPGVRAAIIKDAGDDPDVTHGAEITVKLQSGNKFKPQKEDYLLMIDKASIILRGGKGVGCVTRKGLDVLPGKWAINPGPRQMIIDNLKEAGIGLSKKNWLLEITVADGEKIALKTLNPTLGIKNGISILGTTGIVVPHSNQAYIDTIEILLKNAAVQSLPVIVLCTGAKTFNASRKIHPKLPEEAFLRIADFIAETLAMAKEYHFPKIHIACMPGKLFKYSQGHKCTHAYKNQLQVKNLIPELRLAGISKIKIDNVSNSVTIREILNNLSQTEKKRIIEYLGKKALKNFQKWTGKSNFSIHIFGYDSMLLKSVD